MDDNNTLIANYLQTELDWDKEEPKSLYKPIAYAMGQNGKRIRPNLLLLITQVLGGDRAGALDAAVAFEMLHNFTLIHDDIMDNAELRRGEETVAKQWGTNVAILAGDTLFAKATEIMLKYRHKQLVSLMTLFLKTTVKICEGQQMDLDFETQTNVTVERYLKMIEYKTGVLFGACAKAGSVLGSAGPRVQKYLYDFGVHLGVAFQIQDDLLDVYGDPEKFGKPIGGDIKANKKTYPYIYACDLADKNQKKILRQTFASPLIEPDERFTIIKEIYDELDIKTKILKICDKYFEAAIYMLEKSNIGLTAHTIICDFVDTIRLRKF